MSLVPDTFSSSGKHDSQDQQDFDKHTFTRSIFDRPSTDSDQKSSFEFLDILVYKGKPYYAIQFEIKANESTADYGQVYGLPVTGKLSAVRFISIPTKLLAKEKLHVGYKNEDCKDEDEITVDNGIKKEYRE
jgi:hypothetical protein